VGRYVATLALLPFTLASWGQREGDELLKVSEGSDGVPAFRAPFRTSISLPKSSPFSLQWVQSAQRSPTEASLPTRSLLEVPSRELPGLLSTDGASRG